MEEIKAPKKERKFLKTMGEIGLNLFKYLLLDLGKKVINKVGNKKQGLVIAFVVLASSFIFAQFPANTNKQRLGFQTTADGLVWRGSVSDTASIQPVSNQNAWVILDTVNLKIYSFDFTSNVWNQVGGGTFAQPIDSLFFKTSVPSNNVDTAKMRWDSELATLVLGMYDAVPNELGFKNFWLVKNQTGSTITKNSLVYASGTVGSSGRISVSKFIANGSIDAKYLLGITAHDLTDGEDGYVISFGKIRQVNTDTFTAGAILYPSPTVAGVWTDVEPIAPNLDMPIGFCINSHVNNGTIAIRVASGYKLNELHDVQIISPVDRASLYYSGGLWRDTTATLLVSDTASMLANYATKAYANTSGKFYARQDFENVTTSTLTWTQSDTLSIDSTKAIQVYRNGQILLPTQYTIPTNTSIVIGASAFKIGENYTVIFSKGGGSGSGSGSLTSISAGTGITVSPNPITTTGVVSADLSVLMELTDTSLLNLTSRFATKQNNITLTTTGTSGAATLFNDTLNIPQYTGGSGGSGTVTNIATGYGITGGPITTTGTLSLDSATIYDFVRDSIVNLQIGRDTLKILKQEYNNVTSDTLIWTTTNKFPIQLRAYILLFRNGQLLINDQYSIIDTNKVKVAATSYKIGENYTLVTVSGNTSISSGQNNTVYPEAGIAVSTGTTWTTSIPNNSTNWNTAYTDRLKWDGGSTGLTPSTGRTSLGGTTIGQSMFTLTNPSAITFPRFNADNSISALNAASFRSAIGAGTVTEVDASATAGNPISITNKTTTPIIELLSATSSRNGYLTSTDWTIFNGKLNISDTASMLSNYNSRINLKLNIIDTAAMLSNYNSRINLKVNISDTTNMLNPYFRDADTTSLNLTTRFAAKQNNLTLTTTGTSGAATLIGSTLNIPQYTGGGGGSGTVTSVALTAPSIFSVSGSPITTSGTLALTYSGTALPLLNGGTGATTADGALTNFGASAVGKSLFSLTNSVSDKFIKVNTDNTITLLNAADTRTAIGAGVGTVTNVTATSPMASSGGTTPNISMTPASVNVSGYVTHDGTQIFTGNKTFLGQTTFTGIAFFKDYTYQATRLAGLSSTDRLSTVTLGSGLSLSGGILSATSGGVTSVTASSPLSSSGGATPNITITDAGTGASGVVNTGTQIFAGEKEFQGRIKTTALERVIVNSTGTSISLGTGVTWLNIHQDATVTVTLPAASSYRGREIIIKQTGSGQVQSASANIIGFTISFNSTPTTAIINPLSYRFVTLVSDGTNWIIMQRNN